MRLAILIKTVYKKETEEFILRKSSLQTAQLVQHKPLWVRIWKMKEFYLIILLPFALMCTFNYGPMYGIVIAFKDFKINRGILGSDWNNFEHFKRFFNDIFFWRIIGNTLRISALRLTLCFAAPLIFALLLNEVNHLRFKKIVQTISYLPHFMSWVVIAGFCYQLLSPQYGLINWAVEKLGGTPQYFMGNPYAFVQILISAMLWQGIGWGSIVYLAAIAGIDQEMYEAAEIDGASRFQRVWYITLPSITPMITILFILSLRSVLAAGFDPVYNLQNSLNISRSQTIETYVFEQGLINAKYGYSAAVGLFQNLIGLVFLFGTNFIIKRINDQGIF